MPKYYIYLYVKRLLTILAINLNFLYLIICKKVTYINIIFKFICKLVSNLFVYKYI